MNWCEEHEGRECHTQKRKSRDTREVSRGGRTGQSQLLPVCANKGLLAPASPVVHLSSPVAFPPQPPGGVTEAEASWPAKPGAPLGCTSGWPHPA